MKLDQSDLDLAKTNLGWDWVVVCLTAVFVVGGIDRPACGRRLGAASVEICIYNFNL